MQERYLYSQGKFWVAKLFLMLDINVVAFAVATTMPYFLRAWLASCFVFQERPFKQIELSCFIIPTGKSINFLPLPPSLSYTKTRSHPRLIAYPSTVGFNMTMA